MPNWWMENVTYDDSFRELEEEAEEKAEDVQGEWFISDDDDEDEFGFEPQPQQPFLRQQQAVYGSIAELIAQEGYADEDPTQLYVVYPPALGGPWLPESLRGW